MLLEIIVFLMKIVKREPLETRRLESALTAINLATTARELLKTNAQHVMMVSILIH